MDPVELLELKYRIRRGLEEELDRESVERARRDGHARRRPRPCGLTVHTGIGCPLGCRYCYIYDMGFPGRATPYPLGGKELLYALTVNPYFVPRATMIAVGSVTEPFLRETKERAFEYLRELGRTGGLVQVSTKMTLTDEECARIRELVPDISVLVTIVTTKDYKLVEPNAPSPEERVEMMARLVRQGVHVSLFLRPIIPGLSDRHAEDLLNMCLAAGVRTVVLGTLRVTRGILNRLRAVGIDLSGRVERAHERRQIPIRASDLKKSIARIAERLGMRVYWSACGANVEAHGAACAACRMGPCGDASKLPDVDEGDLVEVLRYLRCSGDVEVRGNVVEVRLRGGGEDVVYHVIRDLTRREVIVRRAR